VCWTRRTSLNKLEQASAEVVDGQDPVPAKASLINMTSPVENDHDPIDCRFIRVYEAWPAFVQVSTGLLDPDMAPAGSPS
jgi:hypothetical protein